MKSINYSIFEKIHATRSIKLKPRPFKDMGVVSHLNVHKRLMKQLSVEGGEKDRN